MFVSVNDTSGRPDTYVILADDGSLEFGGFGSRAAALVSMRTVWLNRAVRHGLSLAEDNLRYWDNSFTVDGMDPDEWIITVCGCGEDGGTVSQHVS